MTKRLLIQISPPIDRAVMPQEVYRKLKQHPTVQSELFLCRCENDTATWCFIFKDFKDMVAFTQDAIKAFPEVKLFDKDLNTFLLVFDLGIERRKS